MPELLRVKGVHAKTCLVEHLVEKRVRTLEYLRLLHTREDVLWMNTIRLGKTDICSYFGVDRTVSDPRGTQQQASKIVIKHVRTESMGSAAASSHHVAGCSFGASPPPLAGLQAPDTTVSFQTGSFHTSTTASPGWLDEYLPIFFALGTGLSDLLLVPLSGSSFVDSVFQLLLELDVIFASGSAARVLAGRALKNHRWARAQSAQRQGGVDNTGGSGSSGSAAPSSPADDIIVSAKPHLIDEHLLSLAPSPPSYDLLVPSLCTTLVFVYRRMCDFDATEDTDTVKQILHVDRRLKKLVIGNLSKELQKLAKARMVQQALVLTDHILGAFSQADDTLVTALMNSAPQQDSTGSPRAEDDEDERSPVATAPSPREAFAASVRASARPGQIHRDPFWSQVTDDEED